MVKGVIPAPQIDIKPLGYVTSLRDNIPLWEPTSVVHHLSSSPSPHYFVPPPYLSTRENFICPANNA